MKRLITSLASFGVLAMVLAPLGASASTSTAGLAKFVHPENKAVDLKGDSNGIGKFNSNEANKNLKRANGKVTAVSATSITMAVKNDDDTDEDGVTLYTFLVDANTKVLRKFKGTAKINEVAVGDQVKVWATALTDGTAKLIWDKSIWWVSLKGKISAIDTTAKTVTLRLSWEVGHKGKIILRRPYQLTVKTDDMTKYFQGLTEKAFTDLVVDQRVAVRGSWNKVGKYVLAGKISILQ